MKTSRRVVLALSIVLIPTLLFGEQIDDADTEKGSFHGLEYRLIGPAVGGRVSRVAGVTGDDLTYHAATAATTRRPTSSKRLILERAGRA